MSVEVAGRTGPQSVVRQGFTWLRTRRDLASRAGWLIVAAAFLLLAGAMAWILQVVVVKGAGALTPELLTTVTQGNGGGLLNAIEGAGLLSAGSLLLATPFGMAAGIYVAEFNGTWWAKLIRFLSDVLVGVPSIVFGYAGYVIMVERLGWHFSLAAGCITLASIAMPYICRTTELAILDVPATLREAGYGLGARDATVILRLVLPAAAPGILTGVLLALSISIGETAPLLYTAGWSSFMWNGHLTHTPVAYLTYAVYTFINEPFASANALAYAAAFLVVAFVLAINVIARVILHGRRVLRA